MTMLVSRPRQLRVARQRLSGPGRGCLDPEVITGAEQTGKTRDGIIEPKRDSFIVHCMGILGVDMHHHDQRRPMLHGPDGGGSDVAVTHGVQLSVHRGMVIAKSRSTGHDVLSCSGLANGIPSSSDFVQAAIPPQQGADRDSKGGSDASFSASNHALLVSLRAFLRDLPEAMRSSAP